MASSAQVEIHPANKDLLRFQLLKIGELFSVLKKTIDLRAISQLDAFHGKKADKLPQDTKHQIGCLVQEGLSIDTDNLYHSFCDGKCLVKVLTHFVDVEVGALVDGTHVNGILLDVIDHVDKEHTIGASVEQIVIVGVNRQSLLDKLIVLARAVKSTSNNADFFTEVVVMTTRCRGDLGGSGTGFGLNRSTESGLTGLLDKLHHIKELNPVDDTVSVFVNTIEHRSNLIVADIVVAHAFERIFKFNGID